MNKLIAFLKMLADELRDIARDYDVTPSYLFSMLCLVAIGSSVCWVILVMYVTGAIP